MVCWDVADIISAQVPAIFQAGRLGRGGVQGGPGACGDAPLAEPGEQIPSIAATTIFRALLDNSQDRKNDFRQKHMVRIQTYEWELVIIIHYGQGLHCAENELAGHKLTIKFSILSNVVVCIPTIRRLLMFFLCMPYHALHFLDCVMTLGSMDLQPSPHYNKLILV